MATRSAEGYEREKERQAAGSRERSALGREIGPLPPVGKPRRRSRCRRSLRAFCETYLASRFTLAWSQDHVKALDRLQTTGLAGGQFAFAMPRGSGKTSLCEATTIWAVLYGHRSFVVLVGATEAASTELCESIKVELETNDLLVEDFPEVCYPIRRLEGIANRANGQTLNSERTRITWTDSEIVLPTVARSKASGAVIRTTGITGRIRGMRATTADGRAIRPDLVVIDDPQTDESARSPTQNAYRERILSGAVLGLAGPRCRIAAVCPCTVIAPGDMADRILDRDRHPEWQGERSRLLRSLPTNEARWEEYARLRADGLRAGEGTAAATSYYVAHREEMDAGCVPSWPERYLPDQVSAIQYGMDLRIDDPMSFAAEYQNEPLTPAQATADTPDLDADQLASRLTRLPRGVVPRDTTRLTVGVDVQGGLLFWLAVAWREDHGGAIVDYGSYPPQNRAYFAASDARPSLADAYPGLPDSARIFAAVTALAGELAGRSWPREGDGAPATVERILVDAGWGQSTDAVYQACRQSPHAAILLPAHGRGIGASSVPMRDWARRPGERRGRDWVIPAATAGRGRHVTHDANSWKTFIAERLRTPPGAPGCLQLWGDRPHDHQLLADHLTAEHPVRTEGRGRRVDEWRMRADRRENHWFDCLVLAAVGASIQGLAWSAAGAAGQPEQSQERTRPVRLSEMQARRRSKQ